MKMMLIIINKFYSGDYLIKDKHYGNDIQKINIIKY